MLIGTRVRRVVAGKRLELVEKLGRRDPIPLPLLLGKKTTKAKQKSEKVANLLKASIKCRSRHSLKEKQVGNEMPDAMEWNGKRKGPPCAGIRGNVGTSFGKMHTTDESCEPIECDGIGLRYPVDESDDSDPMDT